MTGRREAARTAGVALAVVLALALLAPGRAAAAWEQVGGKDPINRDGSEAGNQPSLEEYDGTPYVAWVEDGQIQAARLNASGTAWERPEDSPSPINLSPSAVAEDPTLRRDGPTEPPCVAFDEAAGAGTQIHMSCLTTATDWTTVGDSPNRDLSALAAEPSLTIFEAISWVAWSEVDSAGVDQIRVAKLPPPGEHWARVPDTESPINAVASDRAFDPSLVAVGSQLYVAWNEIDAAGVSQIHVARLNASGDGWELVGDVLNKEPGHDAFEASMADVGGVPYVAWSETDGRSVDQARVARLDESGDAWELVADSASPINHDFDENAEHPSLSTIGGLPYVSWSEKDANGVAQVRVARPNATGTAWEEVVGGESPINDNAQLSAGEPVLAAIGGLPYVSWSEEDAEGVDQVWVSRLAPDFLSAAATGLAPDGATLEAKLRTYGLPFPVGFEYGEAPGDHETTPALAPIGEEEATISQMVAGLSPKADYQARPFATAGVPLPRVWGDQFGFKTPAVTKVLAVSRAGAGSGTVTSTPAGIACGSSCEAHFEAGSVVTLEALAAPGSTFAGWSGGGCTGRGACQLVLNADATVTASFQASEPNPPPPGPSPPSPPSSPGSSGSDGQPGPSPGTPTPPTVSPAPPGTKILGARINSAKGTARLRFRAVGERTRRFRCALQRGSKRARFRPCRSPRTYRNLRPAAYTFRVRAVGAGGVDASPAVRHFRIRRARS